DPNQKKPKPGFDPAPKSRKPGLTPRPRGGPPETAVPTAIPSPDPPRSPRPPMIPQRVHNVPPDFSHAALYAKNLTLLTLLTLRKLLRKLAEND
ncbi:MAG: hypothetical protein ACC628_17170, partial [Pirellulaceae bacterium]